MGRALDVIMQFEAREELLEVYGVDISDNGTYSAPKGLINFAISTARVNDYRILHDIDYLYILNRLKNN